MKMIILLKLKPKPKTTSTLKLDRRSRFTDMNVKNVMMNLRNKITLNNHSYSHNRKYLENTEDFDIDSSQNKREYYITDKGGIYIEDIDEATNYSLEEIKNCHEFRKVKSFKYKITAESEYEKRTKAEIKTTKIFFNTDYFINNATQYMKMETSHNG